jgi:F-type H+-transporting ATPase subunit b
MELLKQLSLDPKVAASTITGFILLFFFLRKFLFGPIMGIVEARDEEIRSTYGAANDERSKAEALRADYEKRLADVDAEARVRLQAAVQEAEGAKSQIVAEAKDRAEKILQRAQDDLAREREKTIASIREEVVNISLSAAGKLIGESLDEPKHRNLVTDFIDRIGTAR